MNALAPIAQFAVSDMERMARAFAGSKLFGVTNPEQALALCLIAQAEGRHPASAAQDYHIIQGKPSKKADAMLRDFLSGGGKVEWHKLDDTIADATFSHPAGGSLRITWDMKRAQQAQLKTAMWTKFPRQMLRARVVSEGVRTVFPMATSGMYVPEEVQEFEAPKVVTTEPNGFSDANMQHAHVIEGKAEIPFPGDTPALEPRKSSAQAKRDGDWEALKAEIDACADLSQLNLLVARDDIKAVVRKMPRKWVNELNDYVEAARERLPPPNDYVEPDFANMERVD